MKTLDYKDKEIEVTDEEFELIWAMLMVKGTIDGLNNVPNTPERFKEVQDETIGEVLEMRESRW